jgi:hypothetical protein
MIKSKSIDNFGFFRFQSNFNDQGHNHVISERFRAPGEGVISAIAERAIRDMLRDAFFRRFDPKVNETKSGGVGPITGLK